jgi:hypothetical protein
VLRGSGRRRRRCRRRWPQVTKVPLASLPKGCQASYIEIYELRK